MNQESREKDLIDIAISSLDLRLLSPVRLTPDGFEVMLSLDRERYSKKELREMFRSRHLSVYDVDTLRDGFGFYAYSLLRKEKTQWKK